MLKKIMLVLLFNLLCTIHVYAQLRAFDSIFPNLDNDIRAAIFGDGYLKSSRRTTGFNLIGRASTSDIAPQIINAVLDKGPGYVVESISVIPGEPGDITLLDVYNALGNIRDLKGRLYDSHTRAQAVPLFEDATRIMNDRQSTAIPDPPPARLIPRNETVFIRLRDANFGNSFYRGEMALIQNGLYYTLTNFRSLTYLFVPVIREEKFIAQLYFEPINEGTLIYSIAGADISDFFASRIHVDSAISKRLGVITSWAIDGIVNRN